LQGRSWNKKRCQASYVSHLRTEANPSTMHASDDAIDDVMSMQYVRPFGSFRKNN
jgi:hypothetical protein